MPTSTNDLNVTRALGEGGPPQSETVSTTMGDGPKLPGEALDVRLGKAGAPAAARYEVRHLEGIGATSRVYAAFDRDLAREVAVKVLSPASLAGGASVAADEVSSFIDEARVTAGLSHPNVLPVYELDAGDDGRVFFTMKRIDGLSLGAALERRDIGERVEAVASVNALVSVIIGVCQALAYAHHRGVIHQDVKPDNVMLGHFGEVLLVDWGSAALAADAKPKLYGTPLYMSPEQARLSGVTPQSDVYATGATMFHALVGRAPTGADALDELIRRRSAGEIDPPTPAEARGVPAALLGIAMKAMAAEPAARYASMDAMLADLRAYQEGLAVSAHRDSPLAALARWYRRNRRLTWVALVAALAVALAGGAWWREKAKEQSAWLVVSEGMAGDAAALSRDWIALHRPTRDWKLPIVEVPLDDPVRFRPRDGGVEISAFGNDCLALAWRGTLGGDFRVEWDYRALRQPRNLNCFIGRDRQAGFTFHVGGYGSTQRVMVTAAQRQVDQRVFPRPLEVDRTYRFAMEKAEGRVRLEIDGEAVIDYPDYDVFGEIDATAFGFDAYPDNIVHIGAVRVLARPLPQRISPLAVARKLVVVGKPVEAGRQYGEIMAAYPGTSLGLDAHYERALMQLRSDRRLGTAALESFLAANPEYPNAPMAVYEMLVVERNVEGHDAARVRALRERLAAYRGHPVLRTALAALDAELSGQLELSGVRTLGDRQFPADIESRTIAMRAELERWAALYGLDTFHGMIRHRGANALMHCGRADLALEYAVEEPLIAMVLGDLGRYDEALARIHIDAELRGNLLFAAGRQEAVAADERLPEWQRAQALWELGRHDELLERFPKSYSASNVLLKRGLFAEHAARWPDADAPGDVYIPTTTAVYARLRALGDWAELERRWSHDRVAIEHTRYTQQRWREAASTSADAAFRLICGLGLLGDGDEAGADELFAPTATLAPSYRDVGNTIQLAVVRPLVPLLREGRGDARAALADLIERRRYATGQRAWHIAAYIAGEIDEGAFRAQPYRRSLDEALLVAQALRADVRGERAEARARWRQLEALPAHQRMLGDPLETLVRWRKRALGE